MAFSDEQIQIGALPGFMEILPRSPEDQRQKHFLPPGCIQQWIIWIIKLSFPFFSYSSASEAGPKRFCVALCKVAYFPTFLFFLPLLTFTYFWLYSYIFFILNNIVFCTLCTFSQTLSFAFFPTISFPPLLSFEKIASRQSSSCKLWVSLCRI